MKTLFEHPNQTRPKSIPTGRVFQARIYYAGFGGMDSRLVLEDSATEFVRPDGTKYAVLRFDVPNDV